MQDYIKRGEKRVWCIAHVVERDYSQKLMGKQRKRLHGRLRYG